MCGKAFQSLKIKNASVNGVGAGLRNHINDTAGSSTKFRRGSSRHHLKLLDRIQRNVNSSSLSTQLLAKESVVVITTVQADVVEYSALPGKCNLITVRTLNDANSRCQSKQVFEFPSENRSLIHRSFIQRDTALGLHSIHGRCSGDRDAFLDLRDFHCHRKIERLTDS